MNYTKIKKIPAREALIAKMPVSIQGQASIMQHRLDIQKILSGEDSRWLIVVGPCSAWPEAAVLEYAKRLKQLSDQVSSTLKIVMRVYTQKPRTTKGWIGPMNQPNPLAEPDIVAGLSYARRMMVEVVEMGLPIADEALFTHNAKGFLDLLSWVAIGARSSEDQEHRIFASAVDCAVGLKNPTHGALNIAVNSVIAAQHSHVAVFDGYEVKTHGNAYAHLVLRGSREGPNYSVAHLDEVQACMQQNCLENPAILIDVSHDNCFIHGKKDPSLQPAIIQTIIDSLKTRPDLKTIVKGFMIESFLKEGQQTISANQDIEQGGLSITDPCLGWEQTAELLLSLANQAQ